MSAAQALAYAHAVNLRAADVPSMGSRGRAELVNHPGGVSAFLHCAGMPAGELVLAIHSPLFVDSGRSVRSTVALMPSEALAKAYVSALASRRGRLCLLAQQPKGVQGRSVSAVPAVPGTLIGHQAVGIRERASIGVSRGGAPALAVISDTFVFASGPAVIKLIVDATGKTPPAPALSAEQKLLSLLYSRAAAHRPSPRGLRAV